MSIRVVVTRGFGSFGTIADVARRGYGATAAPEPAPAPAQTSQTPAGRGRGKGKRRRVFIGDDEYFVTREELWALLQDYMAEEEPELPAAVVTKPAPKRVNKLLEPGVLERLPQPLRTAYRQTVDGPDVWVARMIAEALRARIEALEALEQDDEEVLLLLH